MSILLDSLPLPDLTWIDENSWTGVRSVSERTIGGTPIVWEASQYGRPITLQGKSNTAWVTRSVLLQLKSMASIPEAVYVLSIEGVTYNVRFRNEEQPVVDATPLIERPNPDTTDYYVNLILKFQEVD